ncbi:MAG: hypothetical protein EOO62_38525 [Hymenobacter sp.]|nr:MAG: hypothetical protein EOO62_38525 [Hymenobacter sp.]
MKLKCLLLSLLLFPLISIAQGVAPAAALVSAATPYRYCALVVDDSRFVVSNRLLLDYGQRVKDAPAEPEMAEIAKNISGSTSVIDALNYLSRHGWELLSVTNVPYEISGTSSQFLISETRYLLRRRVPAP